MDKGVPFYFRELATDADAWYCKQGTDSGPIAQLISANSSANTVDSRRKLFCGRTKGARLMSQRKPYSAPRAIRPGFGNDYLKWMTSLEFGTQEPEAPPQSKVKPEYKTIVNNDRRFVEVSDGFCRLVGYTREELLGMRYDDLTAPNTVDIQTVQLQFLKLGRLHGLWLFVSREGTRILVRYESWLRNDSFIEGHMEVVGAGY
jgi:PAS domain S-box-containing protein